MFFSTTDATTFATITGFKQKRATNPFSEQKTGQFYGLPSLKTDGSPRPNSSATLSMMTHPFVGNAVDREQWGTYQGKGLCQRAHMKRLEHAWAESDRIVVPFVFNQYRTRWGV
jgi:hypothetical protein